MQIEQVKEKLKEIEDGARKLLSEAESIGPSAKFSYRQSRAIKDLQNRLRYWICSDLGEAKVLFELEECRLQSAQKS